MLNALKIVLTMILWEWPQTLNSLRGIENGEQAIIFEFQRVKIWSDYKTSIPGKSFGKIWGETNFSEKKFQNKN